MFLKQKYDEEYCEEISGGRRQARTADILLVRQALSQLSYTPTKGFDHIKIFTAHCEEALNPKVKSGGTDGTRTRDPLRDRQVF